MSRQITFVSDKKVGFYEFEGEIKQMAQAKCIEVGNIVIVEDGTVYKVAAISFGDDASDYGDLLVFKLNAIEPDVIKPFDVKSIFAEVAL